MTIRSLVQKMRSKSHRVVHNVASTTTDSDIFSWSELPDELLREILIRVEKTDGGDWPSRRNVVVCAGVCRNWRILIKEIVSVPEFSSKLTLPISLKQPGPRDSMIQCFIKRNRDSQSYHLYLGLTNSLTDTGKFLLAAFKLNHPTCTDYNITLSPDDNSKRSNMCIGKVRSNFFGTKFSVYDCDLVPQTEAAKKQKSNSCNPIKVSPKFLQRSYPIAHILYKINPVGARGPRRMSCIMNTIPMSIMETRDGGVASTSTSSFSTHSESEPPLVLRNKPPGWHEQQRCWCLNFNGRVTVASIKNFQLVAVNDSETGPQLSEKIILQFGKVGRDLFTMDYGYPISAYQAFAICLSSFESRITCE